MHRHPHWELSLSNYFESVAFLPFKWGEHDCCLFAAGAVAAMTGEDFAADFRGTYTDATSAKLALRERGAGTLQKTLRTICGPSKHPAQAKRGDVVMFDGALGICCGSISKFIGSIDEASNGIVATGEEGSVYGLIPISTSLCSKAWTVAF